MNERNFTGPRIAALLCLFAMAAGALIAQPNDNFAQLQADAVARIRQWRDHVRRTGDAQSTLSELVTAQGELKTTYAHYMQVEDFANAAWAAINLGDILRFVNRWGEAVPIYEQASQLAERAGRKDYQTRALARQAFSELNSNQLDAAALHVERAVQLGANCGNPDYYFDALDTAAEVETKRGNFPAASAYVERALALSSQLKDKTQLYLGYGDRGEIYYKQAMASDCQRQYDVCFEGYDRSKKDYERAQSITQEAGFTALTKLYADLIQTAEGQKSLLKNDQSGKQTLPEEMFEPKVPKDVLATEMFYTGGVGAGSLELVKKALEQAQGWVAQMQRQGLIAKDYDPFDAYNRGLYAAMSGDQQTALTQFRQAVQLVEQDRRNLKDEQARTSLMEDKSEYYNHPALLLLQQKRYAEAFSLFEQARSRDIADMLWSRQVSLGTGPERELFSRLQTQRTAIAAKQQDLFTLTSGAAASQNVKKIADLEHEIEGMQQAYQQLETSVATQAPKLKQLTHAEPASLESVQRAAGQEGFDVLYYVVTDTALIVWHVNGAGVQVRNVFLPRSQLISKVSALRASLDAPDTPFDEQHARQLYLFLIQPMASFLSSRHLVIIPHEELNSIPFQVLLDGATGKSLGESYAVSYAPSATVLGSLAQTDALQRGKLLAVGEPGLAAAIEEVNAIGKLYPNRSKVLGSATKTQLASLVGDYNVVHLSMHGEFVQREPLLSYLQLQPGGADDGKLTASEMFGLGLKKNAVAVLSACETGRVKAGHSNEVEGIVRALLYAGAGTLVLSAWKVDAAATNVWMQTFYREGQSKPPAEAAHLALIAVKSRPNYNHPYYWAPFLLTGR